MRCSMCGSENPENKKFCGKCGAKLGGRCAKCRAENPPDNTFCGDCGASLSDLVVASPANSPAMVTGAPAPIRITPESSETLGGERKTVTALFADIKGSMELMEDIDPEEARAIVDPALKLMIDCAHHFDGYIVQSTGDGVFALFGAPRGHEDHPQRALYAALRMQDGVKHYAEKLRAEKGVNLQVRVGVNTGEVVVRSLKTGEGQIEYTPIGHSISLASRLQTLAAPGSTAVSESTRKLVEGYFALKPLGPARIRGVSEPVNVFEVTGLGPIRTRLQRAAGRGYTKFVGRQREMEALKHAAGLAQSGHGQIVAAMAEAGTGKSRLFFEFKATSQSGWLVLEALSVSHGKASAYLPLIDLLHLYFRIMPDDDARIRREKVAGRVTMLDRTLEETLPHLFALLGIVEGEDLFASMGEEIRRRRTQDAIKRILLRESLNQPLMLIFEDLHWIDDETQGFLNLLADGIANAPVLLLVNYRPEYSHHWNSKTYYTQLRLDPLGKESAEEMLSALLGDGRELAPLRQVIIEKTSGNPLFMEEIFQALVEDGSLHRNGDIKLVRPVEQLRIPPTVQGILASRIDRLQADEKQLLHTLAVMGTEFPLALVRQVAQISPDRLDCLMGALQTAEFIYEQPAAGDIEYMFKHALTHDVAYNSVLTERRKILHQRTGEAIEALYQERLDDHYTDLAYHYRSSDNATKAIEYLRLAGEQAVGRGAYAQGLAYAEAALKLIDRIPEGTARLRAELGVRLLQGMTVTALSGMASSERLQIFERVCQLSESLRDAPALFRGLLNMGFAHSHRFEALRARSIAQRCVKVAERDLNEMLPAAYSLLTQAFHRSGEFLQAASAGREAIKSFASAHQPAALLVSANLWVVAPISLASIEQTLGKPDLALKFSDESLRRARELKHFLSLTAALHTACLLRCVQREPEAARELAEAMLALAEEHGFREFLVAGKAFKTWATIKPGQTGEGVAELETLAQAVPNFLLISKSMLLAQVFMRVRRVAEAIAHIDEELARIEQGGAYQEAAELHRLKGEAILMQDSSAVTPAETSFRKAIETARGQSAKWWELLATTSLARLLRDTGRRDEARAMLAEIYGWFTEGFDTADLKDAKALLDELKT